MSINLMPSNPSTANNNQPAKVVDEIANQVKTLFIQFIQQFQLDDQGNMIDLDSTERVDPTQSHYIRKLRETEKSDTCTLFIHAPHVDLFNPLLFSLIKAEYYRFQPALHQAVYECAVEFFPKHPKLRNVQNSDIAAEYNVFHAAVYDLGYAYGLRACKTDVLGQLMTITGTVTRTSQVRPELHAATFICLDCQTINRNVRQQFKYTEPQTCLNGACANRVKWELDMRNSHFVDWQSVRVQENSGEIPPGSMPRTMKVVLRNEVVDLAKPGDKCSFTGTLVVVPDVRQLEGGKAAPVSRREQQGNIGQGVTGLKELGVRDLTYSLVFIAHHVESTNSITGTDRMETTPVFTNDDKFNAELSATLFTEGELKRIRQMSKLPKLYSRIVKSLAPNICGHDDIKRGMLLMMLGGVHKSSAVDKTQLRGDINVCLIGDPSTSKSQFLKYVHKFMPRAVYTSGKASSAAGLTASVVKDSETGEFAIEAGALMLADNGICCIDEFDKMELNDQVAIHEAMEQQTISISKAGIQATLNARTSILAAANPIYGRYDRSKTLKQNVDISAPIMSRFDLFFVVLDDNEAVTDFKVARHILNVHTDQDTTAATEFSIDELRTYIKYARMHRPILSPAAKQHFIDNYINLRNNDSAGSANKSAYRITVRQLESMIRLSEARARLSLSMEVQPEHVQEAARLLKKSIVNVESQDVELDGGDEASGTAGGDTGMRDVDEKTQENDDTTNKPVGKKKVELPFKEYKRISNMIVMHLRQHEARTRTLGTKQIDIIKWYSALVAEQDSIQDEEQLRQIAKTTRLIIQRLHKIDHILLEKKQKPKPADDGDRLLYVHPNYSPEDDNTGLSDDVAETAAPPTVVDEPIVPQSATKKRSAAGQSTTIVRRGSAMQEESKQPDDTDEVANVLHRHKSGKPDADV